MHVDLGLSDFQYELKVMGGSLKSSVLTSEKLIAKEVSNGIIDVADRLTKLSRKRFYIDEGRSWREFLQEGE